MLGIHIHNKIPIYAKFCIKRMANYDPKMIPVVDSIVQNIVYNELSKLGQSIQTIHSKGTKIP